MWTRSPDSNPLNYNLNCCFNYQVINFGEKIKEILPTIGVQSVRTASHTLRPVFLFVNSTDKTVCAKLSLSLVGILHLFITFHIHLTTCY